MKKAILSKFIVAAFTLAVIVAASTDAFGAATIVILNNDAANTGFNDPTPVSPVGNNNGTTLGQQRLNAFQFAANLWGATINSNVTITVRASWASPSSWCSSNGATLGATSAVTIVRDFQNAPQPSTWYTVAEANALSGTDLNNSPTVKPEISTQFNSNLGNTGCLDGTHFYLGLDNNHGADVDLVTVVTHELAHGLGFQTFTDGNTGAEATSSQTGTAFPSIYDFFLLDDATGKTWVQMGTDNATRHTSATNGKLVWSGAQVDNDLHDVLGPPARLRVNAPAAAAGNYTIGIADFGPPLTTSGVTANVAQALPADGCSPVANLSGRLALIDRGNCNFTVKVKNAQNAGAVGVIVANNQTTPPVIDMGGSDSTITIPSVMVSLSDGNTLKSQLAGLNATLLLDTSALAGTDSQGRAMMYAPGTFDGGSSVSHWDTSLFPNQLMEPNISGDLIHSVAVPADLTGSQLRDVGWAFNPIGDVNFFVRQHYLDFLNRQPDTSGQGFWTNDIFGCGIDTACADVHRINTSAAFFLSIEFQETGYFAIRVQRAAFGRHSSDPTRMTFDEVSGAQRQIGAGVIVGQGNWQGQLETNKGAYAAQVVADPNFASRFPQATADTYVDALFSSAGIVPTSTERQNAINAYNGAGGGTAGRVAALRSVADSDSVRNAELNPAFVLLQYHGYLRRDPDESGYQFWLNKLNSFGGNFVQAEMVKAFITSTEYRNRFGPA